MYISNVLNFVWQIANYPEFEEKTILRRMSYGTEPWDGSIELYDMFPEEFLKHMANLKEYVPNYRINLIDAGRLENLEQFQTDLQKVFGMLRYRGERRDLVRYLSEHPYFQQVDTETYQVLRAFLHSEKLLKENIQEEGRGINMCKALEELYNDGRQEGREEGRERLIVELFRDGVLSVAEAAKRMKCTESEFFEILKNE